MWRSRSRENLNFGQVSHAPSHLSVVGALVARQQTQSWVILLLVLLLSAQGLLLHLANKKAPISVYGVDSAGQSRFLGEMSARAKSEPSREEVVFVAKKFASLLHDRNSSTIRENLRQALAMCAVDVQRKARGTWQSKEMIQQVRDEQVRTEIAWENSSMEGIAPGTWLVRLRGNQALFPLTEFDVPPWKSQRLHVEVSLRLREREPILFPSGLEVVGYTILDRRASSPIQE